MVDTLQSGRDMLLFGVPLVVMLGVGIFRLDEVVSRKPPAVQDEADDTLRPSRKSYIGCEPDGTPLRKDR